jgi:hypothetical protein
LFDAEKNSAVLNALQEHRDEVEKAVGETLQWDDVPLKRACRIRAITNGDIFDEDGHQALIDWMMDHQLKIKAAIKPLIEQLSDDYWTSQDSD